MQVRYNRSVSVDNFQTAFNHRKILGKKLRNGDNLNSKFKMEQFLKHDKEFMKMAMLKHEETFRQQVPLSSKRIRCFYFFVYYILLHGAPEFPFL
jgi:hypothetical protein